jgi:hypothetical protein
MTGEPPDASWLDFLSGAPAPSGIVAESSSRDNASWPRDRPHIVNSTIALEPASRSPSLEASPKVRSNKRSRLASELDDRAGQDLGEIEIMSPDSGHNVPRIEHVGGYSSDREGEEHQ